MAAGRDDDAVRYLREQIQSYRAEPQLYAQLAQSYAAQGKQALQHVALAESYALSGSLLAALEQLTIARKAPDATYYEQALIDAREREWRTRRMEEVNESKK
jgi:beta-barrel assembly-enhancing protease